MNLLKYISLGFLGYRVYSLYAKKAAGAYGLGVRY
jgi:hypothetical protein